MCVLCLVNISSLAAASAVFSKRYFCCCCCCSLLDRTLLLSWQLMMASEIRAPFGCRTFNRQKFYATLSWKKKYTIIHYCLLHERRWVYAMWNVRRHEWEFRYTCCSPCCYSDLKTLCLSKLLCGRKCWILSETISNISKAKHTREEKTTRVTEWLFSGFSHNCIFENK